MSKSKNHTAKAHRNGIKRTATQKYKNLKGVDPKFRRNSKWAAMGTQKAVAEAKAAKKAAA